VARRSGFLAEYSLEESYLLAPEPKGGRAGLLRGRDTNGHEVLIKIWRRSKRADESDVEDIWRSEIRQLQRLAALPRADELFVPMLASEQDEDGYYLVLDPGRGSPLETLQSAAKKPELLAQARISRARRLLWQNARRLAEGLELLHSQGAIHRSIDPWAVFTGLSAEPDFRLTGFEWSMRIASVEAQGRKGAKLIPSRESLFSFKRDWRDLGLLLALLLDVPQARLADLKLVPSEVADYASAGEVRLLRAMLGLIPVDRLDGVYISDRIDELVDSISAEAAGRDAQLCVLLSLGTRSRLSQSVREASSEEIELDDQEEQIRFVKEDLGAHPRLIAIGNSGGTDLSYGLAGNLLTYRLARYRPRRSVDEGTWEFAQCDRADKEAPASHLVRNFSELDASGLEFLTDREAHQSFSRRRGRVRRWDDLFSRLAEVQPHRSATDNMHLAFTLLLMIEMAFAAADIFPIEIVRRTRSTSEQHSILIVARRDKDREELSKLLQIDPPAARLAKLLESDEGGQEAAWTLSEQGILGDRKSALSQWSYSGTEDLTGLQSLRFEGPDAPMPRSVGFVFPTHMVGRTAQFKRRVKALAALRDQAELLRMLVDPRGRIEKSHDPLDETSEAFKKLDSSKQAALREIMSTIPLFLLQGPPGVGKTYLVGDIVRRRFEDEAASRILLSAQSNSAIDHLMGELKKIFENEPALTEPLMVRARPADDDEAAGDYEVDVQAERLLTNLSNSPLAQIASEKIKARLSYVARATSHTVNGRLVISPQDRQRLTGELRATEGIVLRAANLVFATTNSGAVERLIEDRSLFDWTIVEEAAKATGGELLSPLLLSHRRLMLGDHKQLPPFDIDRIRRVLSLTESVRRVVEITEDLLARFLRDPGLDDTFEEVSGLGQDLGRACADTIDVVSLFETFAERELQRQKKSARGKKIALRLTEQYRMHPAIARIVSACFYEGELETNKRRQEQFARDKPPVISNDPSRLPDRPIVFVDMPYSRSEAPGGNSGEKAPPWSNTAEISAVIEVLSHLRSSPAAESMPPLAVLSPYWRQVTALRTAIDKRRDTLLAHLSDFAPAIEESQFCGTVDSFQGGEADAVVVSLVRNNAHAAPARALGFLTDNRRMNVLLSRARWRLIVIGSLEFLERVVKNADAMPNSDVGFVKTFLLQLAAEQKRGEAAVVPWASLRGGAG